MNKATRKLATAMAVALAAMAAMAEDAAPLNAREAAVPDMSSEEPVDDGDSILIPIDEAEARIKSIVETGASGGHPLPELGESLSYRYDCARQDFVDGKLGFDKPRNRRPYPELATVGEFSGIQLDLAAMFAEAVKGNLAQFPDGEIRWTEDGTNGLSLLESDAKLREAQIRCVRDAMDGRETANKGGTAWILDDDFIFGYVTGLRENHDDGIDFIVATRRDFDTVQAGTYFILKYLPSQTVLDSIAGVTRDDEPSLDNLRLLREAGLLELGAEDEEQVGRDGRDADGEDSPEKAERGGSAVTQGELNAQAAKGRDEAIAELGRRAAQMAFKAPTAAEADRILGEFRRAIERCVAAKLRPRRPGCGTIEPMLEALDAWMTVQRQIAVWDATPEQRALWDAAVSGARGLFRGAPFVLRDGQAEVAAPSGPHWSVEPALSDGTYNGTPPPSRQWLLKTIPQWCFRYRDYTMFLLVANALDENGHKGFGEAADDDTLLLYWLEDGAAGRGDFFKWSFMASGLHPLIGPVDAVTFDGDTLRIDTSWRSKDDGGPVIYKLERFDDGDISAGLWDYAASVLHGCAYIHYFEENMVLKDGPHADCWPCEGRTTFRAIWRHPIPDDALDDFLRREQAHSADLFMPIPELEVGNADGAFDMPQDIGDALTAIYLDRASYDTIGSPGFRDEERDTLVARWRSAADPPFLTVRAANAKAGGGAVPECVDFSFTRDGRYLVIEDGYLIMPWTAGDGVGHDRAICGIMVFKVPEDRREDVRVLVERAALTSRR